MRKNTTNILLITLIMACVFLGTREITPAYGLSYGTPIKSIQQGTGTASINTNGSVSLTSGQITTAVVVANSQFRAWACNGSATATDNAQAAGVLTGTQTATIYLGTDVTSAISVRYTWELTEYY